MSGTAHQVRTAYCSSFEGEAVSSPACMLMGISFAGQFRSGTVRLSPCIYILMREFVGVVVLQTYASECICPTGGQWCGVSGEGGEPPRIWAPLADVGVVDFGRAC